MKTNLSSCCNAEVETYYDDNDCLVNICPTCRKKCDLASPEVIDATSTICANCGSVDLHYVCEKKSSPEVIERDLNCCYDNVDKAERVGRCHYVCPVCKKDVSLLWFFYQQAISENYGDK